MINVYTLIGLGFGVVIGTAIFHMVDIMITNIKSRGAGPPVITMCETTQGYKAVCKDNHKPN